MGLGAVWPKAVPAKAIARTEARNLDADGEYQWAVMNCPLCSLVCLASSSCDGDSRTLTRRMVAGAAGHLLFIFIVIIGRHQYGRPACHACGRRMGFSSFSGCYGPGAT